MIIKHRDVYDVTWTVNMDLTGATVRVLARRLGTTAPVELDGEITDAEAGVITHTLTGLLPVGSYQVEVEVTVAGEVVTFPTDQNGARQYDVLEVVQDLG